MNETWFVISQANLNDSHKGNTKQHLLATTGQDRKPHCNSSHGTLAN
jgi:hypothetical protein